MKFGTLTCIALLGVGACATKPESRGIPASLVVWPKETAECDFEAPAREKNLAVGTTYDRDTSVIADRRDRSFVFAVKNVQFRQRPDPDQILCMSLLRFEPFGKVYSVYGFHLTSLDENRIQLDPKYARLGVPSIRGRRPGELQSRVVLAATNLDDAGQAGTMKVARFETDLLVGREAISRFDEPATLVWPRTIERQQWAAIVLEVRKGGQAPPVSDALVEEVLLSTDDFAVVPPLEIDGRPLT